MKLTTVDGWMKDAERTRTVSEDTAVARQRFSEKQLKGTTDWRWTHIHSLTYSLTLSLSLSLSL